MRILAVGLALLAFFLPAGDGQTQECDPAGKSLPVEPLRQETISWCWAASAQTVMKFYEKDNVKPQCGLVDPVLGHPPGTCCGDNRKNLECLRLGFPSAVLTVFGYGFEENKRGTPISWSELTKQICRDRPFIFVEEYFDGGGHSYVVKGYRSGLEGDIVEVYDHDPDLVGTPEQGDFEDWYYEDLAHDEVAIYTYNLDIRPSP